MDLEKFNDACNVLAEYGNAILLEAGECIVNGTEINVVKRVETWDGGEQIQFYTAEEDEQGLMKIADEIFLTDTQTEDVCDFIISHF